MSGVLDQLQSAGFSQDEIGNWAQGVRTQLTGAGFNDKEVSAYLGGTVTPPDEVPKPFMQRFKESEERLSKAFVSGAEAGWGSKPLGEDTLAEMRRGGLISDPSQGMPGPLRLLTDAVNKPIGIAAEAIGRATSAGLSGAGAFVGQAARELGAGETAAETTEREFENFVTFIGTESGLALPHFAKPSVDLVGGVRDLPIGSLPAGEDFAAAARTTVGDAATPMSVQEKLLRLYTEQGVHPGEVVADAAEDPTIAQALASRGTNLPERYEPDVKPPQPAKPLEEPPASEMETGLPLPASEPLDTAAEENPIPSAEFPNGIRSFRPGDLTVDAARFQFKTGGDEAGVTERLRGVDRWDPIKAGLSIVWEDENGKPFLVDGHQRYGLAQRIAETDPTQDPSLNAIVLRSADRITDVEARTMAASKNIAEGTGTAIDAAKVLRDQPSLIKDLPPRSELVRQARGLANLSDEAFGAVVNDVVPANYASIVGRLAPDDPSTQSALISLLNKTEPANSTQAEAIVRQGIAAGTERTTQGTLFGDQEVATSLYLDRAKVLDRSLRELRRDHQVFNTLVRDQDIVTAVGNRLEASANEQRLAADQQAVQILQILANRRGALSDFLSDAARRSAAGDTAGAVRDFVAAIRGEAESGNLVRGADGLDRGRPDVAGKDAASIVDVGNPGGGPAAERSGAEAASYAIAATAERTPEGEQFVFPGTEQSARQAAQAREAEGRGRITPPGEQQPPGGIFARPGPEEPGFVWGPETGAISWGARPPPKPGSFEEAEQSILSKLSIGQGAPRRPMTWARLYTAAFDKLYPIKDAIDEGLPAARDPYKLSRLLAGEAGRIEHFVSNGTVDYATGQINGLSLQAVLAPVKDDLDGFRAFSAAARGLELEARGITTGLDLAAMRRVAREGIAKYEPVLTALVEYQNRVSAYLRDAGVLSREGYDAMVEANRLYVPFQRVMEEGFQRPGASMQARNPIHAIEGSERDVVDPIESVIRNTAMAVTMADRNETGVALIDALTRQGDIGFGVRKPVAPIALPPDPTLDGALTEFLNRNGVTDPEGLLDLLHAAASPPEEAGTVAIFRNGTRAAYQVDPELAAAWKGLDAQSAGIFEQIMRPFASTLRAGAVLTPDFALRHTIRDFLYATVTSPHLFTPADMARGFYGLINKDEDYWRWLQSGGANISMVSVDRRYLQEDIARLTEQTGLMTRAMNVVADPKASWMQKGGAIAGLPFRAAGKYLIHPLQVLTELAENASHLGAFKKEMRIAEEAGPVTKAEIQEAGFASRDIAVDAARIGAKARAYNMITAFANITLQDSDRVVRAFVNDPVGTSLKVGVGISLPSALLWWANHDDPRYKELPEWERDMFWIIPTNKWEDAGPAAGHEPASAGTPYRVVGDRLQVNNGAIFRIPKPWGMGIIFGSGVERALQAFSEADPAAFKRWGQSISDVAVPQLTPSALSPILNQWTNRDTFTNRTLIPDRMEKWLPEYQYTPYTTETAKALGRIIGAFPGVRSASISQDQPLAGGVARALTSPILIENYVRGWAGTLGNYALGLADASLRKAGIIPDPVVPTSTLADLPVIKAFVARYPSATTQSIQDFHDEFAKRQAYYQTFMAMAKQGDAVAAARLQALGGPEMFLSLQGIETALNQQSKLIADTYRNPGMTPSDKRQLIDTIYYRMIELGQAGKRAMAGGALAADH